MAEIKQLKPRQRQPIPLPADFLTVAETLGLSIPTLADELCFTLTRRKEGTEIGLEQGDLWWSLSYKTGVYPPSFREARAWVSAYAARYGFVAREVPRRIRG